MVVSNRSRAAPAVCSAATAPASLTALLSFPVTGCDELRTGAAAVAGGEALRRSEAAVVLRGMTRQSLRRSVSAHPIFRGDPSAASAAAGVRERQQQPWYRRSMSGNAQAAGQQREQQRPRNKVLSRSFTDVRAAGPSHLRHISSATSRAQPSAGGVAPEPVPEDAATEAAELDLTGSGGGSSNSDSEPLVSTPPCVNTTFFY